MANADWCQRLWRTDASGHGGLWPAVATAVVAANTPALRAALLAIVGHGSAAAGDECCWLARLVAARTQPIRAQIARLASIVPSVPTDDDNEMPLFLAAMPAEQRGHIMQLLTQAAVHYGSRPTKPEVRADVVGRFAITEAQFEQLLQFHTKRRKPRGRPPNFKQGHPTTSWDEGRGQWGASDHTGQYYRDAGPGNSGWIWFDAPEARACVATVQACELAAAQQRLAIAVSLFASQSHLKLPVIQFLGSRPLLDDGGGNPEPMPEPAAEGGLAFVLSHTGGTKDHDALKHIVANMPTLAPVAVAQRFGAEEDGLSWHAAQIAGLVGQQHASTATLARRLAADPDLAATFAKLDLVPLRSEPDGAQLRLVRQESLQLRAELGLDVAEPAPEPAPGLELRRWNSMPAAAGRGPEPQDALRAVQERVRQLRLEFDSSEPATSRRTAAEIQQARLRKASADDMMARALKAAQAKRRYGHTILNILAPASAPARLPSTLPPVAHLKVGAGVGGVMTISSEYTPMTDVSPDVFTFFASGSGVFDRIRKARNVIFIPSLLSKHRPFATRNFLMAEDLRSCSVVLVVDANQVELFKEELQKNWAQRHHYTILAVPDQRGIPFARHTAKTLADKLDLPCMFFRDDDVTAYQVDKQNQKAGEKKLLLAQALGHLRQAHSNARCQSTRGPVPALGPPTVVGCSSDRHRKNLKQAGGSQKPDGGHRGWTYSLTIDFRFVLVDLTQCRRVSFINEDMRQLTEGEWARLHAMRADSEPVQVALFQGEDFGFCEQLCALHGDYQQTVCLNYLFASSREAESAAGTTNSRYVSWELELRPLLYPEGGKPAAVAPKATPGFYAARLDPCLKYHSGSNCSRSKNMSWHSLADLHGSGMQPCGLCHL